MDMTTVFIFSVIFALIAITLFVLVILDEKKRAPYLTSINKLKKEKEDLQASIVELEELKRNKENQKIEYQYQLNKLNNDISWKQKNYDKLEQDIQRQKQIYQDRLDVISNTTELADKALEERKKVLEVEYQNFISNQTYKKEELLREIKEIEEQLQSLKATKAATIEAARKEQTIKEQKEEYCLILPKEEQKDISLLEDIQYKISKPRSIAMIIWTAYYQPLAKAKFPKILGKQNICGIYKITNQKTDECYIGQAVDVRKRWYEHCKAGIGIDTPLGNKLYKAMNEYGLDDFSFELLEECQPSELNKKEKYFIELYQSNIYGYNISGGNK